MESTLKYGQSVLSVIRSYWLCSQFAWDKTVDHISDTQCSYTEDPQFVCTHYILGLWG